MLVVEFLRKNKEDGELCLMEELFINVRRYDDRIVLNYNLINSPKNNEMVQECRSLILSPSPEYKILSRSFKRFFNYQEDPRRNEFDITKAICYEKVDGSVLNFYYDNSKWCVSTRSTAFAEGPLSMNPTKTFYKLACEILGGSVHDIVNPIFNKNNTYIFEIVSPESRVCTLYEKPGLYILAVKNKETGEEYDDEREIIANRLHNIKLPKTYRFNTLEKIFESLNDLKIEDEGYVCLIPGPEPWRIKIKNPVFLASSRMRQGALSSPKHIISIVMSEKTDDYLAMFPDDECLFDPYIKAYHLLSKEIFYYWKMYSKIEDQKEFAEKIRYLKCKSVLFLMRNKKVTIGEALSGLKEPTKIGLLEDYMRDEL